MNKNTKIALTEAQVRHIANLAKLSITDQEAKKFQEQLSSILGYIDVLNEIDTSNIEPTAQVTGLTNVIREDRTTTSLPQNVALENASSKHNGYFKVQAIFE